MTKLKKETVAESSISENLQHEANELKDDIDWDFPVTKKNVRDSKEFALFCAKIKAQNNLALTFDTAKGAIENCLDNMFMCETVSDARLKTTSEGFKQYVWGTIDDDGRKITVLLDEKDPSGSHDLIRISASASVGCQSDGPLCSDQIHTKHHDLNHVCDVVAALIRVACFAAITYDEYGISPLDDKPES